MIKNDYLKNIISEIKEKIKEIEAERIIDDGRSGTQSHRSRFSKLSRRISRQKSTNTINSKITKSNRSISGEHLMKTRSDFNISEFSD